MQQSHQQQARPADHHGCNGTGSKCHQALGVQPETQQCQRHAYAYEDDAAFHGKYLLPLATASDKTKPRSASPAPHGSKGSNAPVPQRTPVTVAVHSAAPVCMSPVASLFIALSWLRCRGLGFVI